MCRAWSKNKKGEQGCDGHSASFSSDRSASFFFGGQLGAHGNGNGTDLDFGID